MALRKCGPPKDGGWKLVGSGQRMTFVVDQNPFQVHFHSEYEVTWFSENGDDNKKKVNYGGTYLEQVG